MNAPYFHHEVVKRLVVKSFDRRDNERELAHELLAHLYKHEVITAYQMRCGFSRLQASFDDNGDLTLDFPNGKAWMAELLAKANTAGYCS